MHFLEVFSGIGISNFHGPFARRISAFVCILFLLQSDLWYHERCFKKRRLLFKSVKLESKGQFLKSRMNVLFWASKWWISKMWLLWQSWPHVLCKKCFIVVTLTWNKIWIMALIFLAQKIKLFKSTDVKKSRNKIL